MVIINDIELTDEELRRMQRLLVRVPAISGAPYQNVAAKIVFRVLQAVESSELKALDTMEWIFGPETETDEPKSA